ncbi:hypothetical protein [Lichenibacterium ramalinae]|uniref:VOC domain-containing protein n=1 Tax=Lichenibacterium ramalinae TaxID=2316527 RepID=A0A4Q2RAT3_9HYPH|nr:hypothetical protein [Lichenibacterium ramalinae]RYB02700.1 hypothetical protein D3272_20090 [Lichenibacterium ramalinae]
MLEHRDFSLSLVLDGSPSRHTGAARFLAESFGSGVQHIAVGTADIAATAAHLAANAPDAMSMPDTYDGDLDARFVPADESLDRLGAYRVPDDRDAEGAAVFQRFTLNPRRVVPRRGGGAADRGLAVQKRQSRNSAMPRESA